MTGQIVTLTELEDRMTIDDVYDLNIIIAAEADAERRARKIAEARHKG